MTRKSRAAIAAAVPVLVATAVPGCQPPRFAELALYARDTSVVVVPAPYRAPHAYGRAGDLELRDGRGAALTFAATPDASGHRTLHGSLLDARMGTADRQDALLWWRPSWLDDHLHIATSAQVYAIRCEDGVAGVALDAVVDGVTLKTRVCVASESDPFAFLATTTAHDLPANAILADELHPGTADVMVDGGVGVFEGVRSSSFVALAEAGLGISIEADSMSVARGLVHIAAEAFPAPLRLLYRPAPLPASAPPGSPAPAAAATITRRIRVTEGDALSTLANLRSATRAVSTGIAGDAGATATILSANGQMAARGMVGAGRQIMLPPTFGATLAISDGQGVAAGTKPLADLDATRATWMPTAPSRGTLRLRYTDDHGALLPVHVLFRGLEGTPDPLPGATNPGMFAARRSAYLVEGHADVALAPGRYRVVATHGMTYDLDAREIIVTAGATQTIAGRLRNVVDTSEWTSGDFHLHSAPSPDAPVPIDARVASLACEGVDLAVATDHNVITDYSPNVTRLGLGARIATVVGDEITSYGVKRWGHFNAYPLTPPSGSIAPEDAVSRYQDVEPATLFSSARENHARFIQVNHPRMDPQIGYFDLTHFDAASGRADPTFSSAFDIVEAFNGVWMEMPDQTRRGAHDAIGLVRRGMHPVITGNSDSHQLLYEEAGYPRTFVHTPRDPIATRVARTLDTLQTAETTVSSGPMVEMTVDGKPIGSVVTPRPAPSAGEEIVRVHLRVRAPAWVPVEHVELWLTDAIVESFTVPALPPHEEAENGVRFEADFNLAVDHDATLLAWADATTPLPDVLPYASPKAIGFTGLIYVDANADGRIDLTTK